MSVLCLLPLFVFILWGFFFGIFFFGEMMGGDGAFRSH